MRAEQLLAHFDRISDAPDAVPRLRSIILELAVRGKLVSQASNDAPAADFLKSRRLALELGDQPWDLPCGWSWSSLSRLGQTVGGGTPSKLNAEFWQGSIPWVTPKDMKVDFISDSRDHISEEAIENSSAKLIPAGSLLMVVRGMILAHSFPTAISTAVVTINQDMKALVPFQPDLIAMLLLLTKGLKRQVLKLVHRSTHGTGKLLTGELFSLPLPIPPLAEQRRIVAKVDELMGLCDQLEAAQAERESRRDRLATASLARLNNGADAGAFREHARFHLRRLPRLATRPEHVKQLRQTILNLAVRGRLVPQNPSHETAVKFLEKHRTAIPSLEPWKLPAGWTWSSFELIGETIGGGTPSKTTPEFWSGRIPWVSPKDMKADRIGESQDHISAEAIASSSAKLIPTGSLLLVVRGMILAHSFPAAISTAPLTINQDMKAVVPFRPDLAPMLLLLAQGLKPEILGLVQRSTHGTCKLLTRDLFTLPLPVPPLAEQRRIMARVDELLALCDQLEAALAARQSESRRLLEALLHEALAPTG